MMTYDICPSRDDAQPHLYDGGVCILCLTKKPQSMRVKKPAQAYIDAFGLRAIKLKWLSEQPAIVQQTLKPYIK